MSSVNLVISRCRVLRGDAVMKCLIVEDDPVARLDFAAAMERLHYTCFQTDTIANAQYLLKTHQFEIVLLDLQVTDGWTLPLADYLEVLNDNATVILITGTGAFPKGEYTQLAPRIDYMMHKPVNMEDLIALVDYSSAGKLHY